MVIVIGWQVYDIARHTMGLKEAALRLGIIGVVQFVPLVPADARDRLDRRPARPPLDRARIGRARTWLRRGARLARLAPDDDLALLYVVAALLGVGRAFAGPALGALAPNLVPREILPRAIALSSIAWQTGAMLGPALGGYLYACAPFAPYAASARIVRGRVHRPARDPARSPRTGLGAAPTLGADGRRA